ncbi:MAG: ATP-dependent DNA helicase RecG, partial [Thiomonas sp.]
MCAARKPSPSKASAEPAPTPLGPDAGKARKAQPSKPSPLARLGLRSDWDIVLHLPLRYDDETRLTPLDALRDGAIVTAEAEVIDTQVQGRAPRRQLLVRLQAAGQSQDTLTLRLFHFYPNQLKLLQPGVRLRVHGQVRHGLFGWEMVHPNWRSVGVEETLPLTLTPVYPTTAGVPQSYLRKAVHSALGRLNWHDTVPQCELARHHLPDLQTSLRLLHAPPAAALPALEEGVHPAQRRLKFDELLAQQLAQQQARAARQRWQAPPMPESSGADTLPLQLRAAIPFSLTAAQERCVAEIAADLARPVPMHRLLQGDVG